MIFILNILSSFRFYGNKMWLWDITVAKVEIKKQY